MPSWRERAEPLAAGGALATGAAARRLAERVLARLGEPGRPVDGDGPAGVAGDGLLVLLGPDLPWVDGVTWIAQEPTARGLWLPTRVEPDVPAALLLRAVGAPALVAPGLRVSLGAARRVDRAVLEAWLR